MLPSLNKVYYYYYWIITEGQRHLGAVIASQEYKDQYCEEKVRAWKEEIERLSEIARSPFLESPDS